MTNNKLNPDFKILVLSILWLMISAKSLAGADPDAVPVYEEPRHRLVFDRAPVKIMSVNIPPGDVSQYHFHEHPTLYVAINGALMRSQDLGKAWGKPDPNSRHGTGSLVFRNYRSSPQTHRVENMDNISFRLIGILHQGQGMPVTQADEDAAIDNDWFRGMSISLAPGSETQEHQHDYPVIVVQVSDGNTEVVEQGISTAVKTVTGNWSWHTGGVRHVLRNTGKVDAELVEVEIK